MGAPGAFDIIAVDDASGIQMKRLLARPALMAALFLILAAVILALVLIRDHDAVDAGGSEARQAQERIHSLNDAARADFASIFIYQPEGDLNSYMVSDSTDDFVGLAEAVSNAVPVSGERDESFSDLLVFSFKDQSTLELSYSSVRNLLVFGDAVYAPAGDLAPMIESIEAHFDAS
jgi:hypothetical protein